MAEAVFALDADAGGVVDGSAAAADALEKLKAGIEKDQAALKELTAQMKLLQSGGAVNVAQFKQLKEQIDAKKGSIQKASTDPFEEHRAPASLAGADEVDDRLEHPLDDPAQRCALRGARVEELHEIRERLQHRLEVEIVE